MGVAVKQDFECGSGPFLQPSATVACPVQRCVLLLLFFPFLSPQIVLVGDASVGKSSILMRFTQDEFDPSISASIGVDFKIKTLKAANGKTAKISIWDTAGQERFRTLTSSYYRGAHGIIMVFDVTRAESFTGLSAWLEEIEMYTGGGGAGGGAGHSEVVSVDGQSWREGNNAGSSSSSSFNDFASLFRFGPLQVKVLVGNKTDRAAERVVSTKEAEAWAREKGMLFLESSAKNASGVKEVFEELVARILDTPSLLAGTAPPSAAARAGLIRPEAPKPPIAETGTGGGCCS